MGEARGNVTVTMVRVLNEKEPLKVVLQFPRDISINGKIKSMKEEAAKWAEDLSLQERIIIIMP